TRQPLSLPPQLSLLTCSFFFQIVFTKSLALTNRVCVSPFPVSLVLRCFSGIRFWQSNLTANKVAKSLAFLSHLSVNPLPVPLVFRCFPHIQFRQSNHGQPPITQWNGYHLHQSTVIPSLYSSPLITAQPIAVAQPPIIVSCLQRHQV
ncbi:hypothetical protein LINGRAHAP2_LOCUS10055, partial [Linum grandiflorum]